MSRTPRSSLQSSSVPPRGVLQVTPAQSLLPDEAEVSLSSRQCGRGAWCLVSVGSTSPTAQGSPRTLTDKKGDQIPPPRHHVRLRGGLWAGIRETGSGPRRAGVPDLGASSWIGSSGLPVRPDLPGGAWPPPAPAWFTGRPSSVCIWSQGCAEYQEGVCCRCSMTSEYHGAGWGRRTRVLTCGVLRAVAGPQCLPWTRVTEAKEAHGRVWPRAEHTVGTREHWFLPRTTPLSLSPLACPSFPGAGR